MNFTDMIISQRPSATLNGPSAARLLEEGGEPVPDQAGASLPSDVAAVVEKAGLPNLVGKVAAADPKKSSGTAPGRQYNPPVNEVKGSAPGPRKPYRP